MKRSNILLLTVILMLILSMMACSRGSQNQSQASGVIPGSNRLLDLTIALWETNPMGDDLVAKTVQDAVNAKITIIPLDWGTYETQIQLWASANDMPDAIGAYPMRQPWFSDFIHQEVIRKIPYEMIEKYPTVKKIVDNSDPMKMSQEVYEDIYFLPRPSSETFSRKGNSNSIYYRKDWAKKLGFEDPPTDMDTFYKIIEAFTKRDPDGNGRNDTYGLSGSLQILFSFFNACQITG